MNASKPPAGVSSRLRKPSGRRRRNEYSAAGGAKFLRQVNRMSGIRFFLKSPHENSALDFAPPAPRRRRGAGAPCLASPSGSLRLPGGRCQARALSPSGTPAALRSAFAASRALAVSLRSSGSRQASPRAQLLSPLGLRKPAGLRFALALVLPRSSASPSGSALLRRWSCFAGLGTLRFPRHLREPPSASPSAGYEALWRLRYAPALPVFAAG